MDEAGQKNANILVDGLNPRGGTNSYNALKKSIEIIHDQRGEHSARNASILFFTDG